MLWRLVLGVLFNYLGSLFVKPPEGPKASALSDFGIPKAVQGTRIIDFAGTIWVDDPTVAWYGDYDTQAIRKKNGKK